jgi:hypothetical protein
MEGLEARLWARCTELQSVVGVKEGGGLGGCDWHGFDLGLLRGLLLKGCGLVTGLLAELAGALGSIEVIKTRM